LLELGYLFEDERKSKRSLNNLLITDSMSKITKGSVMAKRLLVRVIAEREIAFTLP
jgi:hypothetical protein